MANHISTLTMKVVDQVSGPAKKVEGSLKNLDARAAKVARTHRSGLLAAAGGKLGALAGAAAGYGTVRSVSRAVSEFAQADRKLTEVAITAEASAAEIQQAGVALRALAQETALPVEDLVRGLDVLVQSGMNLQAAMAFLPSVAATAQATASSTDDIAATAAAMSTSLKVKAKDMGRAFDALAVSGKIGQFEIKAMSQHLPRVLASAAKLGFVGADGVQRIGTMLQISKQVSGTAESAAIGVSDAFEKILSPTVLKAAKKNGLDFLKIIEQAQRHGENGAEAIVRTLMKATKGMNDVRRNAYLSSIFTESDSRRFIVAMIEHWGEYQSGLARVQSSHGVVMGDLARKTGDAEAAIQRLSNTWNGFLVSSGKLAYDAGAGGFIDDLGIAVRALSEGLAQAKDGAESLFGASPGALWDKHVRKPAREKVERLEAERTNPALRDVRRAQDMAAKYGAIVAALAQAAEKINPRRASTGEMVTLNNLRAAEAELEAALAALAEARRRAAQAQFGEPGPMSGEDMRSIPSTMGMVKDAMNMKADASAAGSAAMQAFATAMQSQGALAMAMIDRFVAEAKAKLSFTATPRIDLQIPSMPVPVPPPGGSGKQSRMINGSDARRMVREESDTMYRHSGLG